MNDIAVLVVNSILLGVGLAMDAFSVSIANGLNEPKMKAGKTYLIAGVFAFFQAAMPLTGWICVHTVIRYFKIFEKFIPWIALILLVFIGLKMIVEAVKNRGKEEAAGVLTLRILIVQGIATSIDALSAGFTIAEYNRYFYRQESRRQVFDQSADFRRNYSYRNRTGNIHIGCDKIVGTAASEYMFSRQFETQRKI